MADLYEVSGVSEHDRLNFYNASRSTLNTAGGIGEGRSVRQTLARGRAMLRRSDVYDQAVPFGNRLWAAPLGNLWS